MNRRGFFGRLGMMAIALPAWHFGANNPIDPKAPRFSGAPVPVPPGWVVVPPRPLTQEELDYAELVAYEMAYGLSEPEPDPGADVEWLPSLWS